MDIHDYLRVLRRGWPAVLAITVLFVVLSGVYLAVAPKSYESSTALFVSAGDARNLGDLQEGTDFGSKAVTSYAEIVSTSTVLAPAAASLPPDLATADLASMVSSSAPESTRLINIAATASSPDAAAAIANAVAASATRVIPTLEGTPDGRPLVSVEQIRPAPVPAGPASPDIKKVLALGLVVGLCVGLGSTIARQALDSRIRRADDVRELTSVPTLAVLPQARRVSQALVVRDEPTGAAGEAYRTLRTNLRFLEAAGRRSLLFTPVSDDRDGAQVPVNLAWSLAQAGRRVLLVDLDLRNTDVADTLGLEAGLGLADVLAGHVELSKVVRATDHRSVGVILSGTTRQSPADLLSSPVMSGLLRRMEQENDYVILHAPPVLSSSDAAVVAGVSGGTFVTVALGRTRAPELETALEALANVQVRPYGLVMTEPRRSGRSGRHSAGEHHAAAAASPPDLRLSGRSAESI